MTSFYLASSFALKREVQAVANVLLSQGHSITTCWWERDFKEIQTSDEEWYRLKEVVEVSQRNFDGIREADVFLLVAPFSPSPSRKFNGANIELDYAYALGKPIFSIGNLERSAMYVPVHKCETIEEVLKKKKSLLEEPNK